MTYKEKIAIERPDKISEQWWGGVDGCPGNYFREGDGAPICGGPTCLGCGSDECTKCWNTEMPEEKKPETETKYKPSESILEFLDKARDRGDMTIRIAVDTTNNDIVEVWVSPDRNPEEEEETTSEIGQRNEQEAKETIRFLQSKFKLAPEQDVVKHGYWREIRYHKDENGKRSLVEDGIKAYGIVNVYCPAVKRVYAAFWSDLKSAWIIAGINSPVRLVVLPHEPTHWMPTPEPPKGA